jgi:hypothetical protein
VRADPDKVMEAVEAADGDVVIVDPGDLHRAENFAVDASIEAQRLARQDALRRTDEILGRVLEWAGQDTLVLVASVTPPGRAFRLAPAVATGAGVEPGYIVSPSTKREGLVTITDLAPTILAALDVEPPEPMLGSAFRYRPAEVDLGRLRDLDQETVFRERTYYPQVVWFIIGQALLYPVAALVLARGPTRLTRTAAAVRVLLLAVAAFPLATFVFRMIPDSASLGTGAIAAQAAIAGGIALLASRARRNPLSPLLWIMGLTAAVLVADACSGTFLHLSSWLGYSLHTAGRFYGIPNTTFAVLAAVSLLLLCGLVQYSDRRRETLLAGGLFLVVVLIADGAPNLGGDVGGMITLVPLFGLTLLALAGRRPRLRTLLPIVLATVAVVAVVGGLDMLRPAASRTHIGDFADRLVDRGPGELWDTVVRKETANLRILRSSIWTWMVLIPIGFLAFVLGRKGAWDRLLPPGSALRVGVVAGAAGAVLGFLANDSGSIVIALFAVYLLPFVALLALHDRLGPPELRPARAAEQEVPDHARPPGAIATGPTPVTAGTE